MKPYPPIVLLTAVCCLAMLALPAYAHKAAHHSQKAGKPLTDREWIQMAYNYQNEGFEKKDVNQIFSYTTDDYTTGYNGVYNGKEALIQTTYRRFQLLYAHNAGVSRTEHIRALAHQDANTIVINAVGKFLVTAPISYSERESVDLPGTVTFEDVWVRTAQGWALRRTTLLSLVY